MSVNREELREAAEIREKEVFENYEDFGAEDIRELL